MSKMRSKVYQQPKQFLLAVSLIVAGLVFLYVPKAHAAACPAPATDYGSATSIVNVTAAGTYRVWSRIMTGTASTYNSYSLEVDGSSCYVVGDDNTMPANTWTWVDYQNGTQSSKIDLVNLSAGNHTFKMIGREDGVKLDRVVLTTDTACAPTGTGDNCANPPDTTNPTASITLPSPGASVSGNVTINATANDDSGTVTKTELWVDGALVGSADPTVPYSFSWNSATVTNGTHSLVVKAYDPSGNIGSSSAVSVTVNNAVAQPDLIVTAVTVTPTSPSSGNQVTFSATVKNQGAAATPPGTIIGVSFSIDGTQVSWSDTDTTSLAAGASVTLTANSGPSGSATWAATSGSHTVLANVDDVNRITESNESNNTLSSNFTVPVPDTTAPVTAVTSPASNGFMRGTTTLSATATDNVAVTKVEFYRGGTTLIGQSTSTSSPYSFNWNTTGVADGTYSITSKAYDAAGNGPTTSAPVSATVDNTAPATSITAPAASAKLMGIVNVTANGTDTGSGVNRVDLYIDGGTTPVATDTAAPYIYSWDTTMYSNGSHTLTTVVYDNAGNQTASSAVSVTVDNTKPVTSITSPAANAHIAGGSTVSASATDTITGVSKVEFYVDGTLVGSPDTTSPYSFSWNTTTATNAAHTLTVRATDGAGNVTQSSAVSVVVDNSKPVTAITAPSTGATLSGASASLTATATDNVGVTKVEFYRGGTTLIGTSSGTSSPYSFVWNTTSTPNGTYSLTSVAYDAAGNTTTSAVVSITVNNVTPPPPDTISPTVSITLPAGSATVNGPTTVDFIANDNVGVTKVELYIDTATAPDSTDSVPPFGSFSWDSATVADGPHTLTVKAYDAAGNSKTTTVSVTVDNAPPPKPGDVNNDGVIGGKDLSTLLFNWTKVNPLRTDGDLNGDGVINGKDLSQLLFNWGK